MATRRWCWTRLIPWRRGRVDRDASPQRSSGWCPTRRSGGGDVERALVTIRTSAQRFRRHVVFVTSSATGSGNRTRSVTDDPLIGLVISHAPSSLCDALPTTPSVDRCAGRVARGEDGGFGCGVLKCLVAPPLDRSDDLSKNNPISITCCFLCAINHSRCETTELKTSVSRHLPDLPSWTGACAP